MQGALTQWPHIEGPSKLTQASNDSLAAHSCRNNGGGGGGGEGAGVEGGCGGRVVCVCVFGGVQITSLIRRI